MFRLMKGRVYLVLYDGWSPWVRDIPKEGLILATACPRHTNLEMPSLTLGLNPTRIVWWGAKNEWPGNKRDEEERGEIQTCEFVFTLMIDACMIWMIDLCLMLWCRVFWRSSFQGEESLINHSANGLVLKNWKYSSVCDLCFKFYKIGLGHAFGNLIILIE
jgi:hypothetical protein